MFDSMNFNDRLQSDEIAKHQHLIRLSNNSTDLKKSVTDQKELCNSGNNNLLEQLPALVDQIIAIV